MKDAVSKNMGQPARRSVILDRPSPPDEPASVVWANGEYAETVEDPLGGTGDPLPRLLGVERDPKWTAKLVPRGEVKVTGANAPGASETDPARAFGSPDVSVNVTRASGDEPSSANATAGSVFGAPSPSPSPAEAAKGTPSWTGCARTPGRFKPKSPGFEPPSRRRGKRARPRCASRCPGPRRGSQPRGGCPSRRRRPFQPIKRPAPWRVLRRVLHRPRRRLPRDGSARPKHQRRGER